MTAIRVLATAAPDASGHYRIRQPIEAVEAHSDEFTFDVPEAGLPIIYDTVTGEGVDIGIVRGLYDLVILQRPMMKIMPGVIDAFHRIGVPVIVEIDDDFHTAHPANLGFVNNHPKRNPDQNWHHLGDCVRKADHVVVATQALAERYGSHGRVSVIRNSVDDWWLDLKLGHLGTRLGWPGSMLNHPDDPQVTDGAIADVLRNRPAWTFHVIGGEKYAAEVRRAFNLDGVSSARVITTPWKPLELHPYLVATLDIGIVPLADTAFNRAKSWLKGIEFAALGIPFVASATPEYMRLRDEHGIGHTVRSGKHWRRTLTILMDADPMIRQVEGQEARRLVKDHLTISRNWWRWAEVWKDVYERGVVR